MGEKFRMAGIPPPENTYTMAKGYGSVLMKSSVLKKFPVFFAHVYPLHSINYTLGPLTENVCMYKCTHIRVFMALGIIHKIHGSSDFLPDLVREY